MSHDTLIHRIIRPAVRAIRPTGVTPNQITGVRLLTGLLAAGALADGRTSAVDFGAGLFLFSMLLDRADGELARQSGRSSRLGHLLDLVSDGVCTALAFIGLGVGLRSVMGWSALALGFSGGISVGALLVMINVMDHRIASVHLKSWKVAIDPDDLLAVFPVLLWFGCDKALLIAVGTVTPLVALTLRLAATRGRAAVMD